MKKYNVHVAEVYIAIHQVTAESEEEAKGLVLENYDESGAWERSLFEVVPDSTIVEESENQDDDT